MRNLDPQTTVCPSWCRHDKFPDDPFWYDEEFEKTRWVTDDGSVLHVVVISSVGLSSLCWICEWQRLHILTLEFEKGQLVGRMK